ncbi:MAG TPA: AMP-binding protein [Bryobacteraceae bacterium]|jgi:fatty-acyl-CoA synthase|nr:AMP-binding protein [Bryobacteraceae bacterium]
MTSYARGPDLDLTTLTTHQIFRQTVERFPERDALIVRHQNIRLTWRDLANEVERTARGLIGMGLRPGDRVGVWAANCAEWIYLQLGCARAGLVQVNVNPAYRAYELKYILKKSGMKALILRAGDSRSDYRAILEEACKGQDLALRHTIYLGEDSWARMIDAGIEAGAGPRDCHDVVNIQYTSGTTGSPKGVLLTHHNLVNNGRIIAESLRITEADRICVPVPMYHCFGCVGGTMVSINTGAAMILPAPWFDPLCTMRAVQEDRATAIYGVPTMFIAQLQHPEFSQFDFSSLRTGIMAGAPCPIEVMKRVVAEMHCPQMTIIYGQTESSPTITAASVDDSLERRTSTVGKACPATEVKIVSPSGEIVPIGEQGELCTRGYLVMKGYDQEPEATARAIDRDGWLHTGDLATMRPDGYFRITGRLKDMIIRGGENIYPREVEEFLYTHPKIADVQVIGVPDEKMGESVAAWVKLKSGATMTEDDLRDFCKGRIAHFKIPQYVRFVETFPMTVTGKIQKFVMRETEIRDRHLENAAQIRTA